MPDFDAIATALAGRFVAAQVTPPTGFDNVKVSTADLPTQMLPLPAVLVFPNEGTFDTGQGTRLGEQDWYVRFYYNQAGDLERDANALRKWLTVLVDQLRTSVQLGGAVVYARLDHWTLGVLPYAREQYSGIELVVHTATSEGWAATA